MNNGEKLINPTGRNGWSGAVIGGLTKREHFAGLAMQGFAAGETTHETIEDMAHYAVRWADALLKELEK